VGFSKVAETRWCNVRSLYQLALAAEVGKTRMLGTYYRICFLGTKACEFGEAEQGQVYIYKFPKVSCDDSTCRIFFGWCISIIYPSTHI
jgi:hypothetical protein